jgi:hypothetical protein
LYSFIDEMVFSLEHDIKVTKSHQNLLPTQSLIVVHTVLFSITSIQLRTGNFDQIYNALYLKNKKTFTGKNSYLAAKSYFDELREKLSPMSLAARRSRGCQRISQPRGTMAAKKFWPSLSVISK